jgi:hypothetical protein
MRVHGDEVNLDPTPFRERYEHPATVDHMARWLIDNSGGAGWWP